MNNIITIDRFNRLTGQETLHPLVGIADLSGDMLEKGVEQPCSFYALIYNNESLRLINPGEMFKVPSALEKQTDGYIGVLFHPDLLCDTPLEHSIDSYPYRCSCLKVLCEKEQDTISDCIRCIAKELEHAIDRYSSTIIVSQIGLLLNYCTRFCQKQ